MDNTQLMSFETQMREIMNQAPQAVINLIPESVIMTFVDNYGGLKTEEGFNRMVREWNRTVGIFSSKHFASRRATLTAEVTVLWQKCLESAVAMSSQYGQTEFDRAFRERFGRADEAIKRSKKMDDEEAVGYLDEGVTYLNNLLFEVDNYYVPLASSEPRRVSKPGSAAKKGNGHKVDYSKRPMDRKKGKGKGK